MHTRFSIGALLQAVTGVMAIALVTGFAFYAGDSFQRMQTAKRVLATADISRDLFMAMQNLRVERGTINTALETAKPVDSATQDTALALRQRSGAALDSALVKLAKARLNSTGPALKEIRDARERFVDLRQQADVALLKPRDQRNATLSAKWVAGGGKLVESIDALSEQLSGDIVRADPLIAEMMKIKQLGWTVRDAAGFDRLLIGAAVARGKSFPVETRQQTWELTGRIDATWKIIEDDARLQVMPAPLRDAVQQARQVYFGETRAKRKAIIDALTAGRAPDVTGADWVTISNRGLETLINVPNIAFDLTEAHAAQEVEAAQGNFLGALFLMLFFSALGLFAVLLVVRRVTRPMAQITASVRAVAAGDLDHTIPFAGRGDEIGELARALEVFRDNARDKLRMEDELIRKERLSALGQLTATVAHELRNPLSAIRNAAYVLREMVGGTGAMERPVARIDRSVARCDRIIADLLNFTRAKELQRAPVAADAWIEELLNEQKLPEGVELVRKVSPSKRPIHLDGDRMRQVLINLLDNAAQAMHASSGHKGERRIVVATYETDAFLEIVIEDTGPGIPGENLAKVFEPLFSTKPSGTGLGLPTVKQIVEQHGGTVAMTSEVGKGTRVVIRIPHRSAAEIAA